MKRYLVICLCAVLTGILAIGGLASDATAQPTGDRPLQGQWLEKGLFVRGQMMPADVAQAARQRFTTIVDLRPDDESPGQPSSVQMAAAARQAGISFHYVPVAHGAIPEQAVADLAVILQSTQGPVLLYCRSGARAVRTWALAEASRSGGASADAIAQTARNAGFGVDDLAQAIGTRVSARAKTGN